MQTFSLNKKKKTQTLHIQSWQQQMFFGTFFISLLLSDQKLRSMARTELTTKKTPTTSGRNLWPSWLSILQKTSCPASQLSHNSTAFSLPVSTFQFYRKVFHRRLTYTFPLQSQSSRASTEKTKYSKYIPKILIG